MRRITYIFSLLLFSSVGAAANTIQVGVLLDFDKDAETRFWNDLASSINGRLEGCEVSFAVFDHQELDDAVSRRSVELIITDPAHRALLARRVGVGVALLGVVPIDQGQRVPATAGAIVLRKGGISEIDVIDRRELRVAVSTRASLPRFQAQMLRLKGVMRPAAFASIRFLFTGGGPGEVLDALASGAADVAFVPAGFLEAHRSNEFDEMRDLTVAFRLSRPGFPYAVSTPLYPPRGLYRAPDADEATVKAVISVLAGSSYAELEAKHIRAYGFSLPHNEEIARRVAFELREAPYDSEPPISLEAIWNDYRSFIVALLLITGALLCSVCGLFWLSLRFRDQRRLAVLGRRQLERLLETLPDIVYFKDDGLRYQIVNKKFVEFFGVEGDKTVGKVDEDLFDNRVSRGVPESVFRAIEETGEVTFEESIVSPADGRTRTFLTTRTLVRGGHGVSSGILSVSRDISDMRRIEDALKLKVQEQQLLNGFLKTTTSTEASIVEALPSLAESILELLGSSATTRVRLSWNDAEISRGAEAAQDLAFSREFSIGDFGAGTLRIFVDELSSTTANRAYASVNTLALETVAAYLQNFFDRKAQENLRAKSEIRLRKSEAIFRSLMENTPLPVLLSANRRFVAANPAAIRLLGYAQESAIVGKSPIDLSPAILSDGRIATDAAQVISSIPEEGRPHQFEWEYLRVDGTVVPVEVTLTPIVIDDLKYVHSVWTDISERRRVEHELALQRQKLDQLVRDRTEELASARREAEAASAAKSNFLANMSHEMRTPLNAIMGFAHLISAEGQLSRDADRANKIVSASEHLLSLINDILDSSKIEAGMLKLECHAFSVGEVLRSVVGVLRPRIENRGLSLTLELDASLDELWILGDELRFRQIIFNVLGNAEKFTEAGYIRVSALAVRDPEGTAVIEVEVADSGVGIPPDVIDRIFSPFEQAEAGTTRRYGGTGLGLSISRRLARMMGGDVKVLSTVGRGSEFTIRIVGNRTVPLSRQANTAIRQFKSLPEGIRVLVAEDNELNRELATDLLVSMGATVETAINGREAVEKTLRLIPSLVLMDMQMPELDGVSATIEILRDSRGANIPVVAMTANAFEDDRRRCMNAGMVDFLTKPLEPKKLAEVVAKWTASPVSPGPILRADPAVPQSQQEAEPLSPKVFDPFRVEKNFVDHDAFVRIARIFLEGEADFVATLASQIAKADWAAVAKALHARKPALKALTANEYAIALAALERAIRDGDPSVRESLGGPVLAASRRFTEALSAYLSREQSVMSPPKDPLIPTLDVFKELLASGDLAAKEALPIMAETLKHKFGDEGFRQVSKALSAFDFARALEVIDRTGDKKENR